MQPVPRIPHQWPGGFGHLNFARMAANLPLFESGSNPCGYWTGRGSNGTLNHWDTFRPINRTFDPIFAPNRPWFERDNSQFVDGIRVPKVYIRPRVPFERFKPLCRLDFNGILNIEIHALFGRKQGYNFSAQNLSGFTLNCLWLLLVFFHCF